MITIKASEWSEVPCNFTGCIEWDYGSKEWLVNGNLHREDGPARINAEGVEYWFKDSNLHRVDGPAIQWDEKPTNGILRATYTVSVVPQLRIKMGNVNGGSMEIFTEKTDQRWKNLVD